MQRIFGGMAQQHQLMAAYEAQQQQLNEDIRSLVERLTNENESLRTRLADEDENKRLCGALTDDNRSLLAANKQLGESNERLKGDIRRMSGIFETVKSTLASGDTQPIEGGVDNEREDETRERGSSVSSKRGREGESEAVVGSSADSSDSQGRYKAGRGRGSGLGLLRLGLGLELSSSSKSPRIVAGATFDKRQPATIAQFDPPTFDSNQQNRPRRSQPNNNMALLQQINNGSRSTRSSSSSSGSSSSTPTYPRKIETATLPPARTRAPSTRVVTPPTPAPPTTTSVITAAAIVRNSEIQALFKEHPEAEGMYNKNGGEAGLRIRNVGDLDLQAKDDFFAWINRLDTSAIVSFGVAIKDFKDVSKWKEQKEGWKYYVVYYTGVILGLVKYEGVLSIDTQGLPSESEDPKYNTQKLAVKNLAKLAYLKSNPAALLPQCPGGGAPHMLHAVALMSRLLMEGEPRITGIAIVTNPEMDESYSFEASFRRFNISEDRKAAFVQSQQANARESQELVRALGMTVSHPSVSAYNTQKQGSNYKVMYRMSRDSEEYRQFLDSF